MYVYCILCVYMYIHVYMYTFTEFSSYVTAKYVKNLFYVFQCLMYVYYYYLFIIEHEILDK